MNCGIISTSGGTLNDVAPTGTVVAQGSFVGVNGRTVSGVAAVYQTGTCTYAVYLQSISAPTDPAVLNVIPVVNGANGVTPTFATLRGRTGNQTYNFALTAPCTTPGWAQIQIANPSASPQSAQDYGIATLQSL